MPQHACRKHTLGARLACPVGTAPVRKSGDALLPPAFVMSSAAYNEQCGASYQTGLQVCIALVLTCHNMHAASVSPVTSNDMPFTHNLVYL